MKQKQAPLMFRIGQTKDRKTMDKHFRAEIGRFHTAADRAVTAVLAAPRALPHLVTGDNGRLVDDGTVSEEAIREELALLLQNPLFCHSERLARFLRFTIDYALCGRQDDLKEYVIGSEVYDRKPPYHPNLDSIVRTEARRLRSKLKEYYEGEGKDDRVEIYFTPGSYVPGFRARKVPDAEPVAEASTSGSLERYLPLRDVPDQQIAQRESLYSDFIQEASRVYANSLVHSLKDLNDLVSLYALVGRIRLLASDPVVLAAETMVKQIIRQYADANMSIEDVPTAALSAKAAPLDTFSFACRAEFKNVASGRVPSSHSVTAS